MKEENSIENKDDERQNQLLEIYKIQIQSSDHISNRRATLARYYIVVMSALIFGTFKVLENFNKIEGDLLKEIGPEKIVMGISIAGILLSWAWIVQTERYLRLSSDKFNALKHLEKKLYYQFYEKQLSYLEENGDSKSYWELAIYHLSMPCVFFAFFTVLLIIVTFGLDNITFRLLILFPLVLGINLCLGLVNRVALEKSNIQKGDPDE